MQKLAERAGVEIKETTQSTRSESDIPRPADAAAKDDLGFDEAGERMYQGKLIRRLDGHFYVDGQRFRTLGQAKSYIDDRQM